MVLQWHSQPGQAGGHLALCYQSLQQWQPNSAPELLLPCLSAVMAGAVCGDHCSPVSDTTILSSTGAKCNHMDHVTTQLPYAATVATASAVGYIVVGFTESGLAGFVTTAVVLVALVFIVKKR